MATARRDTAKLGVAIGHATIAQHVSSATAELHRAIVAVCVDIVRNKAASRRNKTKRLSFWVRQFGTQIFDASSVPCRPLPFPKSAVASNVPDAAQGPVPNTSMA